MWCVSVLSVSHAFAHAYRQVAQVSASLVASGGQHTGVITAEGKVMTWGCGSDGRLGLGTNSSFLGANSSEPNGRSAKSRDNKSQPNRSLPEEVRGVRVQRLRVERCEEEAVLALLIIITIIISIIYACVSVCMCVCVCRPRLTFYYIDRYIDR